MKRGIALAGTIVADYVKMIEHYPAKGRLAIITDTSKSVGGCVPNTGIDLAKLDPDLPLRAYGTIGADNDGDYIIEMLSRYGIQTSGITVCPEVETPYSDVMTDIKSGERTFFYSKQANDRFYLTDEHIRELDTAILHIGYVTQLSAMLQSDPEYGNRIAGILAKVRARGIITCMDLSSEEDGEEFRRHVKPCLRHCDYLIINEMEAGMLADIETRDQNGILQQDGLIVAAKQLLKHGVVRAVIIHAPEGGVHVSMQGESGFVPSLKLPDGYIKGSVGAGDAFCAGTLYSIYHGLPPEEGLRFAAACAAASLAHMNAIGGMRPAEEVRELLFNFEQMYSDR